MTPRFQLAVAVLVFSAFTLGCAQTPPATQKTPPAKVQAPPAKLPQIIADPKMTISQNAAQLLNTSSVQADLKLSKETKANLKKVYADYDAAYTALTAGATGSDELAAKIDALTANTATKAVVTLSSEQVTRLNQLGIQALALEAFRLSDVRSGLALTPDQTAQFDKTLGELDAKQGDFDAELGKRLGAIGEPGTTATSEENAEFRKKQQAVLDDMKPQSQAIEDLRNTDMGVLLGVLTAAQKVTWQKMTGPPLKGS